MVLELLADISPNGWSEKERDVRERGEGEGKERGRGGGQEE